MAALQAGFSYAHSAGAQNRNNPFTNGGDEGLFLEYFRFDRRKIKNDLQTTPGEEEVYAMIRKDVPRYD